MNSTIDLRRQLFLQAANKISHHLLRLVPCTFTRGANMITDIPFTYSMEFHTAVFLLYDHRSI